MGVVRMSQEYFNVIKTINSMMKMKAGLIFKGKGSDGLRQCDDSCCCN